MHYVWHSKSELYDKTWLKFIFGSAIFKLENMKVGYWAMSKICKGGGGNMFLYFRGYLLCVEVYRIDSGIMSHILYFKIGPKMYCVVYTGLHNFIQEIPSFTVYNPQIWALKGCDVRIIYRNIICKTFSCHNFFVKLVYFNKVWIAHKIRFS